VGDTPFDGRGLVWLSRAMDPDVAEALAKSFLGRLPAEVVDPFLADQVRLDYPAGTTIYRGGEPARAILVISGLIRIYVTSSRGRQVTIRYGRPTDVLGTALIIGGPLDAHAQAVSPTSVLEIDARRLEDSARRDVRLAYAMAEEVSDRLDEAIEQIKINAFGSVKQRVASQLLDLASTQGPAAPLVAEVSQQELADAVGSVREVVARALRDLRAAGIVATSTDRVEIADPIRLHEEARGSRRP
jgi:CRP/FNR family transcriptional regulator, cyclic AMP receptor protein